MPFLDLTLPSPAENLALDEALLEAAEAAECGPILRFWESDSYFVTLGYTNKAAIEANIQACGRASVPILRRCSGGGTVLQGPGCLNYALVGTIAPGEALNVAATNCFVMRRNRLALQEVLGAPVEIAGHTDLATGGLKFSGNAQRRKSRHFLFHGTILLDFDLDLVQSLLRPPSKQPEYRANRPHRDFIRNLPLSREAVKAAFKATWQAEDATDFVPHQRLAHLMESRYKRQEWNLKF